MHQLKSASRTGTNEGLRNALFFVSFGACFVALGLGGLIAFTDLDIGYFAIGALLFLLFGIALVWSGIGAAKLARLFGRAEASVSENEVRRGEPFHFFFQQRCFREVDVQSISIFLVLRERVEFDEGKGVVVKDFDRLVEQFLHPRRIYRSGETIREEHILQLPMGEMGLRNPYQDRPGAKTRAMWVFKIRLDLAKDVTLWKEYVVEVEGGAAGELPVVASQRDVFLMESGFAVALRVTKVLAGLLPHLDAGQISDLEAAKPCLVLERVPVEEALLAKGALEVAGAVVEVRPVGESRS